MPGKYEAGKSYETETGGPTPPLIQDNNGFLCFEGKGGWWPTWETDGSPLGPDTYTAQFYGRLTTEATPTVKTGEGAADVAV